MKTFYDQVKQSFKSLLKSFKTRLVKYEIFLAINNWGAPKVGFIGFKVNNAQNEINMISRITDI